jgi:hypothetical protein
MSKIEEIKPYDPLRLHDEEKAPQVNFAHQIGPWIRLTFDLSSSKKESLNVPKGPQFNLNCTILKDLNYEVESTTSLQTSFVVGYLNFKLKMEADNELNRQQIVTEIIESELSYVTHVEVVLRVGYFGLLRLISKLFLKPLREGTMLTKNEVQNIFSNLDCLYLINKQLLEVLIPC